MDKIEIISKIIANHKQVELISEIEESESKFLSAQIQVEIEDSKYTFDMKVHDAYPFQFHDMETISFVNKELSSYDHVNADGSICVHTKNDPNSLHSKFSNDLNGLIVWIEKYIVKAEKDGHYEHILTPYKAMR